MPVTQQEGIYCQLADCSASHTRRLRGGSQLSYINSQCRLKLERRYIGLREATGELVTKKSQQPDDRAEPLLDMTEVKQVTLLPYDSLPYDLSDLSYELPALGRYPNRVLIRYAGGFVPKWLLLLDTESVDHWVTGLLSYVNLLSQLPNEGLVEMYLWRDYYKLASIGSTYSQFYSEENLQPEEMDPAWNLCVSDRELKDWLANNLNSVFKASRLSDLLLNYLPNYRRNCGSFQIFARLRQLCLWSSQEKAFEELQKALDGIFMQYFPRVTQFSSQLQLIDLERFLLQCQGESSEALVELQQSSGVPFTEDGSTQFASFLDMLFCKANSITDSSRTGRIYQNMNLPMSAYYISTSHNTYLTGDQLRSESSVQCYISALRQGCRCVELDLWDGPKDTPVIYHGHTMTTKIDLEPVLVAIRDHAFECSDAPVILSLEDHCSLQQQVRTADLLLKVFTTALVTTPVDPDASQLPSPAQLRYRVLIKHAKQKSRVKVISSPVEATAVSAALGAAAKVASSLPSSNFAASPTATAAAGAANADSMLHSGSVLVQNPISNSWERYIAVLTDSELLFMSDELSAAAAESLTEPPQSPPPPANGEPLDYIWYHSDASRQEAESRIKRWSLAADGRFLVRPSFNNPGDYSLSFMNNGVIHHCHIRSAIDASDPRRQLFSIPNVKSQWGTAETESFATMADLIDHCRQYGIDQHKYFLAQPVPCELKKFPWYVADTSKQMAEQYLRQVPFSGAFLVRKKEGNALDGEFVLAFRAEREIKRCIISCRSGKAMMGNFSEFHSLPHLVRHFASCPIYRSIRLKYPVNAEAVDRTFRCGVQSIDYRVVCESAYTSILRSDDDDFQSADEDSTMRAAGDYASRAPDELTVSQGDILLDVSQTSPDWWTGTLESSGIRGLVPAAVLEPCNTGEYAEMSLAVRRITRVRVPHHSSEPTGDRCYCLSIDFLANDSTSPSSSASPSQQQQQQQQHQLVMRVPTEDQLCDWLKQLEERRRPFFGRVNPDVGGGGSGSASLRRKDKIAQELSDLVVYCVPTRCPEQKLRFRPSRFDEMISMPETRLPKNAACQLAQELRDFTLNQLVRVYPKATRFNSSNFNPLLPWSLGCQMVALNWQTGGRAMLLNRALFADNGGCGFVLKPEFQPDGGPQQVSVQLQVLAGRWLPQLSSRPTCSFVEVELNGRVARSGTVEDNGLNPVYQDCWLSMHNCSDYSILRISVMETDAWQDPVLIGQFARPIRTLRQGYRSVPLCDEHGEDIKLASLLVHLMITC